MSTGEHTQSYACPLPPHFYPHIPYYLLSRLLDVYAWCGRSKPTPPIPALACAILDRVMAARLLPHRPDQMTVNEYEP
mgnify:CR=1